LGAYGAKEAKQKIRKSIAGELTE